MHKKLFFLFFLIFIHTIHALQYTLGSNKRYRTKQHHPRVKKHNDSVTFTYPFLPTELIPIIIVHGSQSPQDAGRLMRLLIQTNRKTHLLLDDMMHSSSLIQQISKQFGCSNEVAAKALKTKSAKVLLCDQLMFLDQCLSKNSCDGLDVYKKNNINLNFTYEPDCHTALTKCCGSHPRNYEEVARWLLANDTNIDHTTSLGYHTIQYLGMVPRIVPDLLKRSDFNVNFQDKFGNTIVMHLTNFLRFWSHSNQEIKDIYDAILLLLQNTANPQLANNSKEIPLDFLSRNSDPKFKQLAQDAIDGKFTSKQKS